MTFLLKDKDGAVLFKATTSQDGWHEGVPYTWEGDPALLNWPLHKPIEKLPRLPPMILASIFRNAARDHGLTTGGDFELHNFSAKMRYYPSEEELNPTYPPE